MFFATQTGNCVPGKRTMDAFLLLSYGAPERKEEVVPFLRNVLAGKNVPSDRFDTAIEKYDELARRTGRFSPLNEECRALIAGIQREFNERGSNIPVYWGNLYWKPFLDDTVAEMSANGVHRAVCFATSAFDSPQGNRRYADALEAARRKIGPKVPVLDKLPLPFAHPLFVEAQADRVRSVLGERSTSTRILFSAHAIPERDAADSQYISQLHATCRAVIDKIGTLPYELVFQSQSGRPASLWTGPDIKDRVREIAGEGRYCSIVVSPIGFFCENVETVWDLDQEVGELCASLGLGFTRVAAVGAMPKICRMIADYRDDVNVVSPFPKREAWGEGHSV